jgi:hypothetical protein
LGITERKSAEKAADLFADFDGLRDENGMTADDQHDADRTKGFCTLMFTSEVLR